MRLCLKSLGLLLVLLGSGAYYFADTARVALCTSPPNGRAATLIRTEALVLAQLTTPQDRKTGSDQTLVWIYR